MSGLSSFFFFFGNISRDLGIKIVVIVVLVAECEKINTAVAGTCVVPGWIFFYSLRGVI